MRSIIVSAVVLAITLVLACGVDVDISNKACPCGTGFTCDTTRNICVTPAALAAVHPTCDPCACKTKSDCLDPALAVCSATSKTCVECDPANDTCPAGSYCNPKSQCVVGCRASADCAKISPTNPFCATDRHQCVACLTASNCQNGESCSPSGVCVESCNTLKPCTGGASCCGGLCVDTTSDPLNCGACATACAANNGTPSCTASACVTTCANHFAHCGTTNTGCETDTGTDVNHCGGCGVACNTTLAHVADATCTASSCTFTACAPGYGDADGNKMNGCEKACGTKNLTCCPGKVCTDGTKCVGNGSCNG